MSKLQEINNYKREFVENRKLKKSLAELRVMCLDLTNKACFLSAINEAIKVKNIAYICEIKKASPSKGDINIEIDVAIQANKYHQMGATCLSVLTDEKYFKGQDIDVLIAKKATNLPVLRKDFIIDPYQIYEAKLIGADAVLLIMASLSLAQAKEYEDLANTLGLDVLVESHNEEELIKALELKTPLVGINNRDLTSLDINLKTTEELAHLIPKDKILISESGIKSQNDIEYLQKQGSKAFLIGTSLMEGSFKLK
ncbi:MAG: indole-3-glycerol phosphate synthase TrpC [Rickettsiales bacterium]|nr:indole-3-glycerol phosphate synthase TrpC [Rickettsiales bacterium]